MNGQAHPTRGASSSDLARAAELPKTLTGIRGLDEITRGGLPTGRPTLVCGGPGSGKTLLALTFLVNGALHYAEPGVLMTFEENEQEIASDVASLGFDLPELVKAQKLAVDYVRVERSEIEETGEYDLEGLFVRLGHAIRTVGARRVVLDTIESLFAGLKNDTILRSELRRLFRWLKEQGVTALITGERGDGALTRQGLEEYVSDAVILLDHRVHDQVSTRRLRAAIRSRSSISWKTHSSRAATRSSPYRRSCDGCRNRSRRSSATSRTRNACWSGWICVSASDRLMPLNRRHLRGLFEQAGHPPHGERYILRLYVTGMTSRSSRAVSNLKAICEEYLKGRYDLEVIDI